MTPKAILKKGCQALNKCLVAFRMSFVTYDSHVLTPLSVSSKPDAF